MEKPKRYYFKLGNLVIEVNTLKDEPIKIINFIKRDFSFLESSNSKKSDIRITISTDEPNISKAAYKLSTNIFSHEDILFIRYDAKLRKTWVSYSLRPYLGKNIIIHINKKYFKKTLFRKLLEGIIRFSFPNYLYRWQNSLMDIFHGPIIGLIQLNLLRKGNALLHAAAIGHANGEGIAFPGWAQSGKSTIVDRLVKKKKWRFIAEDLCILSADKGVYSFPKQRRFYPAQLKNTEYFDLDRHLLEKTLDKFHLLLHKLLKLTEPKRILSLKEIFHNEDFVNMANLNSIVFLKRGNFNEINLNCIEAETMANMCADMMFVEMQNFNGFYELLSAYGVMSGNSDLIKMITQNLRQIYLNIFKEAKCYILEVPETKELNFIENNLHFKLENIILSRQDYQ